MKETIESGGSSVDEMMQTYYNRVISQLLTYDEAHMHLALAYTTRGPPKSQYFLKKGKSVTEYTVNVTKYGEIERFIQQIRALFQLPEEEDTFISDDD